MIIEQFHINQIADAVQQLSAGCIYLLTDSLETPLMVASYKRSDVAVMIEDRINKLTEAGAYIDEISAKINVVCGAEMKMVMDIIEPTTERVTPYYIKVLALPSEK